MADFLKPNILYSNQNRSWQRSDIDHRLKRDTNSTGSRCRSWIQVSIALIWIIIGRRRKFPALNCAIDFDESIFAFDTRRCEFTSCFEMRFNSLETTQLKCTLLLESS